MVEKLNRHKIKNIEYYNKTANTYNETHAFSRENRNHLKKITQIIKLLDLKKGQKVLEVGVGSGIHAAKLMAAVPGIEFYGIDISKSMIKETDKRLKNAGFKNFKLTVDDGENLSFKENFFDAVYISGSLHHLSDPKQGVKEMTRVLKPGGKLAMMEPNKFFFKNYIMAKTIEIEKNVCQITVKNFKKWSRENNLKNVNISYFIYTIPYPKFMFKIYDKIDSFFEKVPLLKTMSIMIYMVGTKSKK